MVRATEHQDDQQPERIAAVQSRMDDVRAALAWALASGQPDLVRTAAGLLAAARPVFDSSPDNLDTARHFTHLALTAEAGIPDATRGRLLHLAGRLAYLHARPLEALSHLRAALPLTPAADPADRAREVDIRIGLVASMDTLADPACLAAARAAVVAAEAAGDHDTLAVALVDLSSVSLEWGDSRRAARDRKSVV